MAGRKQVTDEAIVAAAREVFVEQGILATMREIAARAGVGLGTINDRLGTKHELFVRAITSAPPPWAPQLLGAVGQGELRANLDSLAMAMHDWYACIGPLVQLGLSVPSTAGAIDMARVRGEPELATYLEEETHLGRARCFMPADAARVFAATIWDVAVGGGGEDRVILCMSPLWNGFGPPDDDGPPSSRRDRAPWPPPVAPDHCAA
jgi:AcrR family transcriptional regulator